RVTRYFVGNARPLSGRRALLGLLSFPIVALDISARLPLRRPRRIPADDLHEIVANGDQSCRYCGGNAFAHLPWRDPDSTSGEPRLNVTDGHGTFGIALRVAAQHPLVHVATIPTRTDHLAVVEEAVVELEPRHDGRLRRDLHRHRERLVARGPVGK